MEIKLVRSRAEILFCELILSRLGAFPGSCPMHAFVRDGEWGIEDHLLLS